MATTRSTVIRKGDTVMVIAGGNKNKRPNKGKTGKVTQVIDGERVVVEGLNLVTRHQRATGPNSPARKLQREASIHISNVMYYAEKLKRPVRIKHKVLQDGKKVRGFINPETKEFEQVV